MLIPNVNPLRPTKNPVQIIRKQLKNTKIDTSVLRWYNSYAVTMKGRYWTMLSLIEVTCPHCGAHGQIMLPPLGAIIVGPCPQCQGLVVVFCGQVLPLDKEVMVSGSADEKREHLMGVLTEFLDDRVTQLVDGAEDLGEKLTSHDFDDSLAEAANQQTPSPEAETPAKESGQEISDSEMAQFKEVDLKLLDNPQYFKSIFE